MGLYINPPDKTKEEWLAEHGEPLGQTLSREEEWHTPSGFLVCLVNNGPYTAAGVCISASELREFDRPDDPRPKLWWRVKEENLLTVCPDLHRWIETKRKFGW